MKTHVLLADCHEAFSGAVRAALQCEPDIEVVAQVSTDLAALAAMRSMPVDVVCVDMRIPVLGGIGATRLLLQRFPQSRVIGLSIHDDPDLVLGMAAVGANGFVLKMDAGRDLVLAIRSCHGDEMFLSHSLTRMATTHLREMNVR